VVAAYPRAEHASPLGMATKKSEDLLLVGARGLEPAGTKCRIAVSSSIALALARW